MRETIDCLISNPEKLCAFPGYSKILVFPATGFWQRCASVLKGWRVERLRLPEAGGTLDIRSTLKHTGFQTMRQMLFAF